MPSLDLFAPRAVASTRPTRGSGCQRQPGPACPRVAEGRAICPGREACEQLGEQEAARLRTPPPPAPAPRPCDGALLDPCSTPDVACSECAPVPAPRPTLPQVIAQANLELGENADSFKLLERAQELARGAPARVCQCGSTTGVVLYERGPMAGSYRCWPCAKGVLEP